MIVPTQGRLLIRKVDRKDVTSSGGIVLPGQTLQAENLDYGEIVDGNGLYDVGQKVFFSRYSATMLTDEAGKTMFVVSDLDIMAIEVDTKPNPSRMSA